METYRTRRLQIDRFESLSSEAQTEYLKALDQQIDCLAQFSNQKLALEIDAYVEKLHRSDDRYSWTGIYQLHENRLRIVSYRGAFTPHASIPLEGGICGAAIREATTLNIADVKSDPRYLSCDFRTKSEVVVPIFSPEGKAIAEIDIDSHLPNAFQRQDEVELEALARELAPLMLQLS